MSYYFEHVDPSTGEVLTLYPGDEGFDLLDRGPQLTVVDPTVDPLSDLDAHGEDAALDPVDHYAKSPDIDSLQLADLLPLLVQNQQSDDLGELVGIETFALSPIESSTGLKGILLDILGPYDNIVTQFKYQQSNNSYYTYVNEITPDYPWIASAVLFIALLVSLFGLLKRGMSWMK